MPVITFPLLYKRGIFPGDEYVSAYYSAFTATNGRRSSQQLSLYTFQVETFNHSGTSIPSQWKQNCTGLCAENQAHSGVNHTQNKTKYCNSTQPHKALGLITGLVIPEGAAAAFLQVTETACCALPIASCHIPAAAAAAAAAAEAQGCCTGAGMGMAVWAQQNMRMHMPSVPDRQSRRREQPPGSRPAAAGSFLGPVRRSGALPAGRRAAGRMWGALEGAQ